MSGRLQGRTVIVTGATKGIGAATVELLMCEGAHVVGTARQVQGAKASGQAMLGRLATSDRIKAPSATVTYLPHDVASESDWSDVIEAASSIGGGLYGVVNNAGAFILKPIGDTSEAEFDQLYRTNVEGTWLGIKHGFAAIQRSGKPGAIVNVSSLMGQVGVADGVAYCATKGAVTGMTKAAAIDGAALNPRIRVNSLHPGVIWTPMLTSIFGEDEAGGAMFAADTPLRRLGKPEDIAEAIVFLLSDDSSYMTGAELTVDGGRGAD